MCGVHLESAVYIPREEEVERYIEEIRQYNTIMNLQYLPGEKEIRLIVTNCPVCIDGEGTEQEEVGGYRNLERIETNAVRGGMALVLAEGLALKAPKVQKYVRAMKMDGWEWLGELTSGAGKSTDADTDAILPKDKYLRDLIGGRPVFSYPMRKGGFRLRYGRSRNTGFAAAGINPATMHILGDFLAVGTQMKIERPGKAAGIVPVDTIEGPTVRLKNGDVLRIDDAETARVLAPDVERILDTGEDPDQFRGIHREQSPARPVCILRGVVAARGGVSPACNQSSRRSHSVAKGHSCTRTIPGSGMISAPTRSWNLPVLSKNTARSGMGSCCFRTNRGSRPSWKSCSSPTWSVKG